MGNMLHENEAVGLMELEGGGYINLEPQEPLTQNTPTPHPFHADTEATSMPKVKTEVSQVSSKKRLTRLKRARSSFKPEPNNIIDLTSDD